MTKEQIEKANELNSKIKEMEEFIKTIEPHKNINRGGRWDIWANIHVEVKKKIIMCGRWSFGCGQKIEVVSVPNVFIDELYITCLKSLDELKMELQAL